MSFLSNFFQDVKTIARPNWRWQQAWIVVSEVSLGFLAMFGYMQGLPLVDIFMGLGVTFACSLIIATMAHHAGRKEAVFLGLACWVSVILFLIFDEVHQWWLYTVSVGFILGLRDAQSIQLMTWIPLRARRRKRNPSQALRVGQIVSFTLQSLGILFSAWMMTQTLTWPYILIVMANLLLVPHFVFHAPQNRRAKSSQTNKIGLPRQKNIRWMVQTSSLITGATFMGKRLLLPLAFALLGEKMNLGNGVFVLFGVALTFVSLVSLIAPRKKGIISTITLKNGLEATTLGWLIVVLGFLLHQHMMLSLFLLGLGWVIVEIAVKILGAGYIDTLRLLSAHNHVRRSKSFQDALVSSMQAKNMTSMGIMFASTLVVAQAPLVVALLGVGAWQTYRLGRHHLKQLHL